MEVAATVAEANREEKSKILHCDENCCAEGASEYGKAGYRLFGGIQGGSFAAAVQGALCTFMQRGEPQDSRNLRLQ
jgi:hypothetical protein